jgi:hypothetical protein
VAETGFFSNDGKGKFENVILEGESINESLKE